MRVFGLWVIMACLLAMTSAQALAADQWQKIPITPENRAQYEHICDPFPDIPVHVVPVFPAPAYEYTQPITALTEFSHHSNTIGESLTLGLTRYKEYMTVESHVQSYRGMHPLDCSRINDMTITFGYSDVMVNIAREIPAGSCGFKEVMGHEQKHIAVNQQILQRYAPYIEAQVKEYLKYNGLLRDRDNESAVRQIKEHVHEIVANMMTQVRNENYAEQRQVDSSTEYHRVAVSCNGELNGVIRQWMQIQRSNQ